MFVNSLNKLKEIFNESINLSSDKEITGFQFDSRNLKSGEFFIALKAERDGHDFIPNAIEKGAVACLVENPNKALQIPQFITNNTLEGLQKIAKVSRDNFEGRVIAITGSCGKTTNKIMLSQCLKNSYVTQDNFNGIIGLPITLSHLNQDSDYAILELGTDTMGNINKLTNIATPDIAIVTSIAPAHLEYFKTIENIEDEKLSIANGLTENGTLIVPHELKEKASKITDKRIFTFSLTDKSADICVDFIENTEVSVNFKEGSEFLFSLKDTSSHKVINALICLSVAKILDLDIMEIANAIESFRPLKGRGEVTHLKNNINIIDEAYNANPLSMQKALESFTARKNNNCKIAFLSDMLELGEDEISLHQELYNYCKNVDYIYTVGPLMENLHNVIIENNQKSKHFSCVDDAIEFLKQENISNCDILVKGSNSTNIKNIVNFFKQGE